VLALVQAVEEKDRYTRGHSERVTAFSVKIAGAMGLHPRQIRMIEYAAVLHDIGKIGIDLAIIQKRGRLTPEEFTVVKNHPLIGERIIRPIGFLTDALPAIAQHHEQYDGSGYPRGLTGERMAPEARILAVADAYDAMITERPYRKPLSKRAAVAELLRCSGSQFDPKVVEHFVELLHNDPEIHRVEVEASTVGT
jgi:HD-GYP domain-containing protein (c-di-GMP phosphodiesterase class II)